MLDVLMLRALEAAVLAGIRPTWALALIAGLGASDTVELPAELTLLDSWPAFGAMVAFGIFEHYAERDLDLSRLFLVLRFGLTTGAAWAAVGTAYATEEEAPIWLHQAIGIGLAVGVAAGRSWLRAKAAEVGEDVADPAKWIARFEESALLLGFVLLLLSPFVLLGALVLMAVGGVVAAFALRRLEALGRRPCPSCGAEVRKEAQRCPACHAELRPEARLEAPARLLERFGLR